MLRIALLILHLLFILPSFGRDLQPKAKLAYGPYPVGFQVQKRYDSTRIYQPEHNIPSRPLLIHVWYPAKKPAKASSMPYKTYIGLETQRDEFTSADSTKIAAYCRNMVAGYRQYATTFIPDLTTTTEEILRAPTNASYQAAPANGSFPLLIYAPSFGKSANQNHIACEYLASYGYIIVSVASAGQLSQTMTKDTTGILAQATDLAWITAHANQFGPIDSSRIGTFGYSWGGMANVLYQMRHKAVKALACWDGSTEYLDYDLVRTIHDFNPARVNVPYLYFCNQNEDWSTFPFFRSVSTTDKHLYRLKKLEHAEFVAYWSFYSTLKPKASSYPTDSYQAICRYTLAFFDAYLKGDKKALQFLQQPSESNGYSSETILKLKL